MRLGRVLPIALSGAIIVVAPSMASEVSDASDVPAPIRRALASVDLTPEQFRFDRLDMGMWGGDRWKLQIFDALIDRPLRVPGDIEVWQRSLLKSAEKPSELFSFATARLGTGVRRGLIDDPVATIRGSLSVRDPLENAIRGLWERSGRSLQSQEEERLRDVCRKIPDSLAVPLAVIVAASGRAIDARSQAFRSLDPAALERDAVTYVVGSDAGNLDPAFLRKVEEPAGAIDYPLLHAGIADLLLAIEKTLPDIRRFGSTVGQATAIDTPYGPVIVSGAGVDHHEGEDPLLLLDIGGDDFYSAGAGATYARPVSILFDLGGNDTYAAADTLRPSFGAGLFGVGILIDDQGNDTYKGGHVGLGCGLYGVGILLDREGDDTYDGITASQGAGLFGIGILSDLAGDDHYHAFQQAQGFGYVKGAGLLIDAAGNDVYIADDTTIRFPSAQSKEHNSSLAQGFGFGKRSDCLDGHSLAGGFGILADGAGNDSYKCGVFGQGCAYWYGVGILVDAAGDDVYDGAWYVQGSGAHFALGVLWEGSGNDRYHATMNMAQGAGHDFSLGILFEQGGDDCYDAPNLSLGGGNANGIGFFWDLSGDDVYNVEAATTLGRANIDSRGGMRDRITTLGLFLDTGGKDTYPAAKAFAGNDRLWTQTGTNTDLPLDTERGAGIDTTWTPGDKPGWRARRKP